MTTLDSNFRTAPETDSGFGIRAPGWSEVGQVVPVVAAVLVIVALLGIGAAELGQRVVERSRAQNAADAAVLGAALQPDAAVAERVASTLARRNGASLVSVDVVSDTWTVHVRSGSAEAVAAARPVPPLVPSLDDSESVDSPG